MADENKEVITEREPEPDKNDSSNREMNIDTPRTKKRKWSIEEKQEKIITIKRKRLLNMKLKHYKKCALKLMTIK